MKPIVLGLFSATLLLLAACGGNGNATDYHPSGYINEASESQEDLPVTYSSYDTEPPCAGRIGFVDKRFELVSLVFRLADNPQHNDRRTDYQRRLSRNFEDFEDHAAVAFAREQEIFAGANPAALVAHLQWTGDGFALV